MPITIQLPDGHRREFRQESLTIGHAPDCQVVLADAPQLRAQHARIRKISGRWLLESLGDWLLQVGDGAPSRVSWLNVGDVIRLGREGPELVFEPAQDDVAIGSAASRADDPARALPPGPPPLPAVPRPGPPPLPDWWRPGGSGPPPLPGQS